MKAAGLIAVGLAAFLTYSVAEPRPLFAERQDVPSAIDVAPPPQYGAAVTRARELFARPSRSRTCQESRWRSAPACPPKPWRRGEGR